MALKNPPKKVGNYQIGEMIGKGAIGVVYRGLNLETGMNVAIKQVSLANIKDDELLSIQSEINLLKLLKHENIVKYIDNIATETHLNIVLEYVESGSLASIIKKFGAFPESLVAIYIKQVLTGLDYLHSQGVVHRDIKGANILTTKEGVVKLADFGVATKLSETEKCLSFAGTPYWMAPEMIEMRGHISTSCDIWSVGCTIIELLTGNPPYHELGQYPAMFRIVQDDHPALPNGISESCRSFLLKCFQKEPGLRIDAKRLLNHSWIRNSNNEVLEIINSPNNPLPEEVTNTIKLHIDKQGGSEILADMVQKGEEITRPFHEEEEVREDDDEPLFPKHNDFSKISDESGFATDRGAKFPPGWKKSSPSGKSQPRTGDNATLGEFLKFAGPTNSGYDPAPFYLKMEGGGGFSKNTSRQDRSQVFLNPLVDEPSFTSQDLELKGARGVEKAKYKSTEEMVFSSVPNPIQSLRVLRERQGLMDLMTASQNFASKKEIKLNRELAELMGTIVAASDPELTVSPLAKVVSLLKQVPSARTSIAKQWGFSPLLTLLDENPSPLVCHAVLQLVNQLIEGEPRLQELACLYGLLPYITRFVQAENSKEVRIEAAYFIGQLAYTSQATLQIFLANAGLTTLVELIDIDYPENKDLIALGIDCLQLIFELRLVNWVHLCRILARTNLFVRLILIVDAISRDNDEVMFKYLLKALDLLVAFAKSDDLHIRRSLCHDQILLVLQLFLGRFARNPQTLARVVRIFRLLAIEPALLNHLENIGLIPSILKLIGQRPLELEEESLIDLLWTLFLLSKLSNPRQELVALHGGIPILIEIARTCGKNVQKIVLPLLCHFVQTSKLARSKLWEAGGARIFLEHLGDSQSQPKVLDTLALWLEYDVLGVECVLVEPSALGRLVEVFRNANKTTFQQIVPIYLKFIDLSERVNIHLGKTPEFMNELVERLAVDMDSTTEGKKLPVPRSECSNPSALVRKELLDILLHLCMRHSNPRALLNAYNLYPVIMHFLHLAQNDDMVILEEISTQILQIYSNSSPLRPHDSKANYAITTPTLNPTGEFYQKPGNDPDNRMNYVILPKLN
eukprot:TRINITY_DN3378_c0_g1_i1.p1 TRINITY_DN3378_c0_g1~~TRINITY_DN3378_c0_g1_i1.p1  ORF type:complete len:1082 (+),score=271.01 TRINITY_DN3378_c0_g1_i1:140-3385(+)